MPFLEAALWTAEDRALVGDFGSDHALSADPDRLLEPLIPPPGLPSNAEGGQPGDRPRTTDLRRLLDGLSDVVRTGCCERVCTACAVHSSGSQGDGWDISSINYGADGTKPWPKPVIGNDEPLLCPHHLEAQL